MTNISISDEFVKSVSLEDFKFHFVANGYDWSETDIVGYWNSFNPTVKAKPTKNDSKTVEGEVADGKK